MNEADDLLLELEMLELSRKTTEARLQRLRQRRQEVLFELMNQISYRRFKHLVGIHGGPWF